MIARVTLEIALRREFDYLIPAGLEHQVEVGTRVQVPFGPRKVLGVVTALVEQSDYSNLKPLIKVIGTQSLVTPKVLQLARWMAEYYCCAPEVALKSVLPEAVRREQSGWRERLHVRALPARDPIPKLTKRQQEVWNIVEERRELPLQELVDVAETTASTVRRLEDKGLISVSSEVSERDPYAHEHIVPTQPLPLNGAQARALEAIKQAMNPLGGIPPRAAGVPPADQTSSPFYIAEAETAKHSGWLPHWRQSDKLFFVTFRLADSVAQDQLRAWGEQKRIWESHHPKPWDARTFAEYHDRFTRTMEQWLDAGYGSCVLSQAKIGELVENALRHFDGDHYQLGDFVIMPNHVHVLVRPSGDHSLESTVHSWKSYTAHAANKVLGKTGPFWREEYFDHLVRSSAHWRKLCLYTQENPGKAQLRPGSFRVGAGNFGHAPKENEICRRDAGSTLAGATRKASQTFLLHGVTGSGKTEVYLQAIAHALEQGKGAIVLVPEIALTPQTVERFKARFCAGRLQTLVAVLHSHLSAGERHDEWHKIRQGRARIVVGARSAVFAPVDPLGLIIVDEEHENSYKQEEAPRYHARDLAVVRGQRENAVVVLGSATPSLETYHNCVRGKYGLLELPDRADNKKMPLVRVVDMRQAARHEKGIPIFSPQLKEAITQRLERREQTILFLNRRGYSTSLQCPLCGYVAECPNCSVSLTYHRRASKLLCHICGCEEPVPTRCPNEKCRNPAIRYAGLGTERVEHTLDKLFPKARVVRMDSDTLKRKEDYRRILGDFRTGKIDILVGTQMIAKGLHFPNVTLVGIIHADMALHQADFRAGERTFQLLTQVAGRAGRGDVEGEVFVQAFTPFHPAIQYARRHDYSGFYEQEVEFRKQLAYPPFSRIALLTIKGRNEDKVRFTADHLRREVEKVTRELAGVVIKGPAAAPLLRAESFYRYQLTLHARQMAELSRRIAGLTSAFPSPQEVTVSVDIDPVDLL